MGTPPFTKAIYRTFLGSRAPRAHPVTADAASSKGIFTKVYFSDHLKVPPITPPWELRSTINQLGLQAELIKGTGKQKV